jgi:hypothetical protein
VHLSRRQCWRLSGIADIARRQTLAVEEPQRTHLHIRMLRIRLVPESSRQVGWYGGHRREAMVVSVDDFMHHSVRPWHRGHHCAADISAVAALRQAARTLRPQKHRDSLGACRLRRQILLRSMGRIKPARSDLRLALGTLPHREPPSVRCARLPGDEPDVVEYTTAQGNWLSMIATADELLLTEEQMRRLLGRLFTWLAELLVAT